METCSLGVAKTARVILETTRTCPMKTRSNPEPEEESHGMSGIDSRSEAQPPRMHELNVSCKLLRETAVLLRESQI